MEENSKIGGIIQSDGRALLKIMSVPDHASVAGTVLISPWLLTKKTWITHWKY
jgi:hypothetical protein